MCDLIKEWLMKDSRMVTILLLLCALLISWTSALAATDGFYSFSEVSPAWDRTDANRTKAPTADYDYAYGDESSFTYTLPWPVYFYGQSYSQINLDTNGNVWFTATGSAHSFDLANTGRGPVIAAWNNDLSSYYYGGVFIQHKTNPERVVIEWQAETYTEEGFYSPNNFEVVLFPDSSARIDYKSFTTAYGKDFGSGISKGNGSGSISVTTNYGPANTLPNRSFGFIPLPTITDTPATLGFGSIYTGTSSPPQTITIGNPFGFLEIGSVLLGGNDPSQFQLSDGCTGHTLSASQSCTIGVNFSPTTVGTKSATVTIAASDPGIPTLSIPLAGSTSYPTLSIAKAGTGTGAVSTSPSAIDCGGTCSTAFPTGTLVTLTATPDTDSSFAGWLGGGCSGSTPCTVALNASANVTATFNMLPPICEFYGSPTAGGAPLSVSFMDLSQRAPSLEWNFGDGTTSTQRNPDHSYTNLGNYTVTLTGTNVSGTCNASKNNYVSIMPVRIPRQTPVYFNTISDAYAAAVSGETIQCQAVMLYENPSFNLNKSVTIIGGYDSAFTASAGVTTLYGATNLTSGAVTWKSFDLHN
jgi:PKD repeat protein